MCNLAKTFIDYVVPDLRSGATDGRLQIALITVETRGWDIHHEVNKPHSLLFTPQTTPFSSWKWDQKMVKMEQ
jgi:hypothetical protein